MYDVVPLSVENYKNNEHFKCFLAKQEKKIWKKYCNFMLLIKRAIRPCMHALAQIKTSPPRVKNLKF